MGLKFGVKARRHVPRLCVASVVLVVCVWPGLERCVACLLCSLFVFVLVLRQAKIPVRKVS